MAARWGAGEEILTACTMDFFPLETLDEAPGLSSVESLETLQSCLDPSIRSIFEDIPPVESKGLDDESEAMLLTVLTEMLDGVDDETLSPFDTLPETDLLSNQRGGELSPLKRILSRSPQEKNPLCSARTLSTGKSRSRILAGSVQRSDGEEEEDGSLTLSPDRLLSSPGSDLLDWGGLTLPLPVGFEQEGEDGLSVSLGDLVRHMHPYCMSISVENEQGEQILPEGGILLEVVDQGENGEPILAIPNMDLPEIAAEDVQSLAPVPDEPEEQANDSSEHIVVDDDDDDETVNKAPITMTISVTPELCLDAKDKMVMKKGKRKEEIKAKSPTRRKKKLKEQQQSKSVEGRVLRSGTVTKKVQESQEKPEKKSVKQEKRVSLTPTPLTFLKPKEVKSKPTRLRENTAATRLPKVNEKVALPLASTQNKALLDVTPEKSQPICSVTPSSPKPREMPEQPTVNASAGAGGALAAPAVPLSPASSESPAAASRLATPDITPSVSAPPAVPEPKTKSLSLAEYRRLREQKKPTPAKKQDDNSTKWPSLPELPKELPPIPCLPNPNPTDPRRPGAQVAKKEEEEVKPAWQPRGPCAPPTPEALLVPPAYMISSSSKTAATAPKPQQAPCKLPPKPPAPAPTPVKNLATHSHTTTQPSLPSGPPSSVAPASAQLVSSANGKCSLVLSGGKAENVKLPQVQHVPAKNVYLPKSCHVTTTDVIKPAVATTPIVPQRNSAVSLVATEVSTSTHLNNQVKSDSKSPKITTGVTQSSSSAVLSGSRRPSPPTLQQLETKKKVALAVKLQKAKTPTQELIESFTTEIGIEASDLTSLLEQFEETQAKVEKCVPEVSGRAAAVGNSSIPEKSVVERLKADDISSTAALTPPATPPHQMWKPLAPVALLGKSRTAETPKSSPSKVIQIEAQPLPSFRSRSKPTPAAAPVSPELACLDHDYCLPNKGTAAADPSKRWNVKQRSFITIKPIQEHAPATTKPPPAVSNFVIPIKKQDFPQTECTVQKVEDRAVRSSVLETPEASPSHQGSESTFEVRSPRRGPLGRSYRHHASSHSPSPSCNPRGRTGRCEKRSRRSPSPMSSCSDSYSSRSRSRSQSRSRSPAKKRYRRRDSDRSSDSSSRSSSRSSASSSRSPPRKRRYSYSSSRSGSWSRSRSRSLSPQRRTQRRRNRQLRSPSYQSSYSYSSKTDGEEVKRRKESAIEERRVVYVGRIRGTMTQKELRERFSLFGEVEECTLHFRDHGDNYGFVTYYDTKDAFTAIENGSKLRKPDELPFDLCFGGRRQFCQASYADLDSSREYDAVPTKGKFHALDFDTLLKQAQANQKR